MKTTNERAATLVELFADSVRRHGGRSAVGDGTTTLTYEELDRRSDAVGALLSSHGVGVEDRVGVYLPRSVDFAVAVLGVLKAGAAYVAVDQRYPDARRDRMLQDSGAKVVLSDQASADSLTAVPAEVVPIGDWAGFDGQGAGATPLPENAASVLFTSGSSGRPKAIVLEHRNIVSFATNPGLPQLHPEDRTGQISNVSFDAFHFEMWTTLAAGAQIVVLPPAPELLAAGFRRQMEEYGVSAMLVPTMVVNHVVREDRDAFASLRVLCAGGDVLQPSACRDLLTGCFQGQLYNLYGPAETTTACTAHLVTESDVRSGTVPIGTALAGVTVRLLDADLREVPAGERGEIFVGGPGLARGYLDRADLTAERFVTVTVDGAPMPMYRTGDLAQLRADGALLFIGRADDQVKIHGYRVEPGEVEQSLRHHPGVKDAVVLAEGEGDDRRLVAFVVLGEELDIAELRARVERDLPDYMVPSSFIVQSEIPYTQHGKRDSAALREALAGHDAHAAEDFAEPLGETEHYVAALWANLLGVERVGRDQDFFALGGHSMLAFRMSHRINRELGTRLAFSVVLDHTTVQGLAEQLDLVRTPAAGK
ncbi:non-ribosomal peptide synthetase [Streptomyces sp. NBC_01549]|uniref:non-ribosomal peptide synthetase n=1 Tax=Streptomyces sp. NBC_01549 TaxID=2975874 RepID=UPI0022546461|nr:non-ribosomal peptide synthetase [Streptomyces sp. NBC_01549]MCX4593664.1 non-ribosomal peptide synthetase [Streptomyces sp. NBC_01549]